MIAGVYKYVYELFWCPKGDIICEFVGTPVLPSKLAAFIAKTEEITGVHRYVCGTPIIAFVGYITYKKLKKRYGAQDFLDLIRKMIEEEFGIGSDAEKIYQAFVQEIENYAEAALKHYKTKFAVNSQGMSIEQQSQYRQEKRRQIIEQTHAALPRHIQKKGAEFRALAKQLTKLDTHSLMPAIGEQAAIKEQASVQLHQLAREIVNPEMIVASRLDYK